MRTPAEFAYGHAEGARNVDINGSVPRPVSELDLQARSVVYAELATAGASSG